MKKQCRSIKRAAAWLLSLACLLSAATIGALAAGEQAASREYVITALVRAAGITGGDTDALSVFADADKIGADCAAEIAAAVDSGVVNGYEDAYLRPQSPITRAEAYALASRCLPELDVAMGTTYFYDLPGWAREDVSRLTRAGLLTGTSGALLNAEGTMTAAEADALAEQVEGFALLKRIERANSYETIAERHRSVGSLHWYGQGKEKPDYRIYLSEDLMVQESAYDENNHLIAGGTWYTVYSDAPEIIYALLDMERSEEENEQMFHGVTVLNFAYEVLTGREIADGLLHITTRVISDERAEQLAESRDRTYHDGDSVRYDYFLDAESLEVQQISCTLHCADGTEELLSRYELSYDKEYDKSASPFAPYFTKDKQRRIILTYAPGTAFEATRSFVVTKGCTFSIRTKDGWQSTAYTDPACTKAYEGSDPEDCSDLHLYLPTAYHEATDEEQAKYLELIGNSGLSDHSSVLIDFAQYCEGETLYSGTAITDGQFMAVAYDDTTALYHSDEQYIFLGKSIIFQYLLPRSEYRAQKERKQTSYFSAVNGGETLIGFAEDEEEYRVAMEINDPETVRRYVEEMQSGYEIACPYQEGMKIRTFTTFEKSSGDELNWTSYLIYPDGTQKLYAGGEVDYEVDSEAGRELLKPYFEMEASAPQRTITVVWAVGTDKEETVTYSVPRGVVFNLMNDATSYTDRACTQQFDYSLRRLADGVTLYVKAEDM